MKLFRIILLSLLLVGFSNLSSAQNCAAPNELTILSWNGNGISVEWAEVANVTAYAIEIMEAGTNNSLYFQDTNIPELIIPGGLVNTLDEIDILISIECEGVWFTSRVIIYTIPDVWIVYDKVCGRGEFRSFANYQIRMHYPNPIYSRKTHLYKPDCFCPGIKDIETYYNMPSTAIPYPLSIEVHPDFSNLVARYQRYSPNISSYFQALLDFNDLEIYMGYHCHAIEPVRDYINYEEAANKTSIEEEESVSMVSFYPNPATAGLTLKNTRSMNATFTLFNLVGATVMQFEVPSETTKFVAFKQGLSGVYLLKIESNDMESRTELLNIRP